ncbi:MAG: hypothetical protein GY719_28620 [bacterium]|nr:hypothetical protein [bacterium]
MGQILAALYDENLLDRKIGKAQGSNAAGYYSLSSAGRSLCHDLGFAHQTLFAADPGTLKTHLTRQRLSAATGQSGRIVAAWGIRGGLGRTTLVAQIAKGLAGQLTADDQRLLAVDLDFASPDLDGFFAPSDQPRCRGLGGLLMDFQRCEPRRRAFFLVRSLGDPKYVVPVESTLRLSYLPSGLGPGHQALSASERAEALASLRHEAERYAAARNGSGDLSTAADNGTSGAKGPRFLEALRDAMATRFERVVIDAQQGHSLGAWIATQALADELVLCLDDGESSEWSIDAVRAILARFLSQTAGEATRGAVKFLFRLRAPTTLEDLDRWIDRHVVMEEARATDKVTYGCEQIPYNAGLEDKKYSGRSTHFYRHLIAKLEPDSPDCEFCPPELQALRIVLKGKNLRERSIAAGLLENIPIEQLARWLRWAEGEGTLPRKTDAEGEKLLRDLFKVHAVGLFHLVLGTRVSWDLEEAKEQKHAAASAPASSPNSGS